MEWKVTLKKQCHDIKKNVAKIHGKMTTTTTMPMTMLQQQKQATARFLFWNGYE